MRHICTPGTEFPRDFGPTEVTGSIYDTLLRYYQVVGSLVSKGGPWGAMICRRDGFKGTGSFGHVGEPVTGFRKK
jgi:hypothetical protein